MTDSLSTSSSDHCSLITDHSSAPGHAEATAIRQDFATSIAGLQAYVSMGFRLMDVKARLPHGGFISWCKEHLGDLSRPHLYRSKFTAEILCEMAGIKCLTRETFGILPPEILALIEGTTQRSLMATVQEYRHDAAESEATALCEARWAVNPGLRDEWQPKCLSGLLTHVLALRGMDGQTATAGLPRGQQQAGQLLCRDVASMRHNWAHWPTIPPLTQTRFLSELPTAFLGAPPSVLDALEAALAAARREQAAA